jgi:hypothetical protein
MTAREFDSFPKLIEYRSTCPICSNVLEYDIYTTIYIDHKTNEASKLKNRFDNIFDGLDNMSETISVKFKPGETQIINIEKLQTQINIADNSLTASFDGSLSFFNLKISCINELTNICEYEAKGDFIATDSDIRKNDDGSYVFGIVELQIYHEIYKLYTIDKGIGKQIKIINDYNIFKTSFALAEMSIDGSNAHNFYKEKRLNLVDDDYFKFENPKKIFSRIDSIFLLMDK